MLVVDFPQLRSAIAHMTAFQLEVGECLDDVERAMTALRNHWHGAASDVQAQAHHQWESGAEQMKSALSQLQKIADTASKNYDDAVKKNGELWEQ